MIIDICEQANVQTYNFERITQFLGQNIITKNKVIDSVAKYFSSDKYAEWENKPNLIYKGEEIGRKYFATILIDNRNDLINQIRNLKTGIIIKLIKNALNEFDYQNSMERINDELIKIFTDLENDIFDDIGNLSIGFEREGLLDIVQKTYIETKDSKHLEELETIELLNIFSNALVRLQKFEPAKVMVIFKNIDHILDSNNYNIFMKKLKEIAEITDSWFLISASLDGYCFIDGEYIEGIAVFNDVVFNMPDIEHLNKFLINNYPYNINEEENIVDIIEKVIPLIGKKTVFLSYDEMVAVKLINDTVEIKNILEKPLNSMVSAFLSA